MALIKQYVFGKIQNKLKRYRDKTILKFNIKLNSIRVEFCLKEGVHLQSIYRTNYYVKHFRGMLREKSAVEPRVGGRGWARACVACKGPQSCGREASVASVLSQQVSVVVAGIWKQKHNRYNTS